MSVIGRLDEQVNDILISPLENERRRRRDAEAATPEGAQDGTPKGLSIPQTQDTTNSKHKSPERTPPGAEELPVWLL
ncbi:MAG TPA: hypothetical protein VIW80_03930 [Pyrinomonadaceae bacterium]|jgi:hypothetical protein